MMFRSILSEGYKLKRSPVLWLHVVMPVLGGLVLRWYYAQSGAFDKVEDLLGFMEVMGMVFPLLIGIVCGISTVQEEGAGHYQFILSEVHSRTAAYLSKLLVLLMLSALAVFFAVGLFSGESVFFSLFYARLVLAAWAGNIFLYMVHLFVGLRFGSGASIGLGVLGTLVSALMMTGLGDRIWNWVPWAWSVRLSAGVVLSASLPLAFAAQVRSGIIICAVATLIALLMSLLWFQRWEGKRVDA